MSLKTFWGAFRGTPEGCFYTPSRITTLPLRRVLVGFMPNGWRLKSIKFRNGNQYDFEGRWGWISSARRLL